MIKKFSQNVREKKEDVGSLGLCYVQFNFKGSGKSLDDFKQGLTLSICVLDRAGSNVEYET